MWRHKVVFLTGVFSTEQIQHNKVQSAFSLLHFHDSPLPVLLVWTSHPTGHYTGFITTGHLFYIFIFISSVPEFFHMIGGGSFVVSLMITSWIDIWGVFDFQLLRAGDGAAHLVAGSPPSFLCCVLLNLDRSQLCVCHVCLVILGLSWVVTGPRPPDCVCPSLPVWMFHLNKQSHFNSLKNKVYIFSCVQQFWMARERHGEGRWWACGGGGLFWRHISRKDDDTRGCQSHEQPQRSTWSSEVLPEEIPEVWLLVLHLVLRGGREENRKQSPWNQKRHVGLRFTVAWLCLSALVSLIQSLCWMTKWDVRWCRLSACRFEWLAAVIAHTSQKQKSSHLMVSVLLILIETHTNNILDTFYFSGKLSFWNNHEITGH